ncbi:MAG: GNAT family N-acetyltransferase [Deltaproteobacteria bacterium]|nr:GNAT family N-acetyltransferase [Deltaproteobacteria bacterium]
MISRLQKAYQEGGLSLIFHRAKEHLFQTHSAWWFCRDLQEPLPRFDLPFRVELSQEPRESIIEYMKRKKYLSAEEYRVGMENGHWFLGLIADQEVKGFCKLGFRKVFLYDTHTILSLPNGASFIYEYEVDEPLRGKGVGKVIVATVLRMCAEEGLRYTFCHIPPKNVASTRVVEDCGFRRLESIRFVEVAGFKWKSRKIEDLLAQAIKN